MLALLMVGGLSMAVIVVAPRLAQWGWLVRAEAALATHLVRWHRPRTIALFADLSAPGSSTWVALGAALAAAAFVAGGQWPGALAVAIAPALAGPLGSWLKRRTRRDRPDDPLGLYFGSSMPSNHTLMATALYGTLAVELLARLGPGDDALRAVVLAAALLVIVTVGASRVLLRVHHPSDVVAAWLLGAAIVAAVALRP